MCTELETPEACCPAPMKGETMNGIRERIAFWLLVRVLWLLPVTSSTREGMLRGLREQREYDRYKGYCLLEKTEPVTFERWRELKNWVRVKASGAESANATLRASGRATFRPAISRL